jgi:O-acetyl-ADP-ribose deacetylase (regulator of RNase III)
MTQEERRIWLIDRLLAENGSLDEEVSRTQKKRRSWSMNSENEDGRNYKIPADTQEQKELLRALMNVRMPRPIDREFLEIQDEYLRAEMALEDIVCVDELKGVSTDSRMVLWQGDITTLEIDAIVNAANSQMCGCFRPLHNCIDNIIHTKSGIQLRLKCNEIMQRQGHEEPTGQAKITPAYNLPCKYVIHTVGPIVQGALTQEHCKLLESSYRSCLELAEATGVTSIAFCCISTGVFMFPNDKAAEIAVNTVRRFLEHSSSVQRVVFNVFKDVDYEIYNELLKR